MTACPGNRYPLCLFVGIACAVARSAGQAETTWGRWRPGSSRTENAVRSAARDRTRSDRRSASDRGPTGAFQTDVPVRPFDIVLGRPTADSVTVSVLPASDATVEVRCGTERGVCPLGAEAVTAGSGSPAEIRLGGLRPNTRYHYCATVRQRGSSSAQEGTFHTQRAAGAPFVFTVQADSHLDENTDLAIYRQTLSNALADGPDFHIDLGDTFMTGKRRAGHEAALPHYLAQRYYFGLLCHSAPLFLALGNHDGETGGRTTAAARMRTRYFPNPFPDGFHTGNTERLEGVGHPQNYYAWEWGDALFIVLDPFRHTAPGQRRRKSDNWGRTLGVAQYRWLESTLERSTVRLRFVFIHHLVGGLGRNARGGVEAAGLYEWGGGDPDGTETFRMHRPGWSMPIHDLLVRHGVNVVFHGHDHFFARQELDGVTYQLVPQPGHAGTRRPRYVEEYGYRGGDILGGSGHLRVQVARGEARVDFVPARPSGGSGGAPGNGEAAFSYTVATMSR